jgi:hypothetical protein
MSLSKNVQDEGRGESVTGVGGQMAKHQKLKIVSYMTNGDKYTLNSCARHNDAYLWNFLDK